MILKELPTYIKNLNDAGNAIRKVSNVSKAINIGVGDSSLEQISAYQRAIKGLNAEQAVAALSTQKLNAAQIEEIMTTESATLAKGTYTQADVQAALAKQGLASSTTVLTVAQQTELVNSGILTSEKLSEIAATLGLQTAENGALVSKQALNLENVKQQLTSLGVVGAQQAQVLSALGLTAAEGAATTATNLLTGAFNALKASMMAHPIGWIIAGVATLVAGLVALKNHIDKTKEEEKKAIKQAHEDAQNALQNSKSELQNVQGELESVKSELTGINDKIKEIAKRGKLEFTDQDEITKLAREKELLEQQQRILEQNERSKARQAATDAKDLLGTKVEREYYAPRAGSSTDSYTYKQTIEEQLKSLQGIYDLYNEYLLKNTLETDRYLPQINEQMTHQKDEITKTVTELYDIVSAFTYADGTVIEGYEKLYNQYMGYINNLQSITDPNAFYEVVKKADEKNKNVDLEKIYNQLIKDAYGGNFDINKVDEKFLEALKAEGIDKSTIETIFKNRQIEYQRILSDVDQAFNEKGMSTSKALATNPLTGQTTTITRYFYEGRELSEKEAKETSSRLKTIHDTLTKYANDNPIDFQVIAAYDDDNFNKLKGYIDKNFKETGDYAKATEMAIQDLKDEMTAADAEDTKNFLLDIDTINSQIDGLKDGISDIASAYSDLNEIIDDIKSNGNLTVENLESLIDLGDKYIGTLFNENGELELNKDSYIALAKAKLEDIRYSMLEKAISQINSLSKDDESQATQSLADSTGNLTEATLKLAAAQKLAEGVDSSKITAIMQTYYQWDALIDNVVEGLESNADATLGVSDATDEATDSTNAYEDSLNEEKDSLENAKDALEDYKDELEDVKDGYEDAIDSIKELINWVQDYIKQIKDNEIDALEEKKEKIDDLIESQKDLLNAEKDEYEWNKTIAEKQNTVASDALAASIASLDDSSAGKKAQKQANEKLAESRTDIIDTLYEHSIDERLDALDELKEEQDDYYDEQIDKIQDYLNNEVQLYKDACNMIDTDSGELYGKLLWYCQNYTTTSETEFNHMWSSAQSAMQQYNTANLGTFDLLNNLQGRIYEVDTAIDEVSRSISEYESAIDAVQEKIDNLGDTAEDTINKINSIKATKVQGSWYVEYRGKKYSSFFDNKSDAINDLRKQVTQSVPFNELNPLLINNGTVKHYASGTRSAKSGIAQINENGLETLMRKTPDGDFVIMNQDDQVYTKKQTDNLYDFASDPEKFLSEKGLSPLSQEELANLGLWGDSSQLGMINSAFGVGGLSGLIEKIIGGRGVTSSSATTNNIAPVVNITIQGDATQSTVNALHAEAENIVQRARNAAHNDLIETVLKGRKWR